MRNGIALWADQYDQVNVKPRTRCLHTPDTEKRGDEYASRRPPVGTHVLEVRASADAAYLVYARRGFAIFPGAGPTR
jgi:hypothetical protein